MTTFRRDMTPAEFMAAVYAEQTEIEAEQIILDARSDARADHGFDTDAA